MNGFKKQQLFYPALKWIPFVAWTFELYACVHSPGKSKKMGSNIQTHRIPTNCTDCMFLEVFSSIIIFGLFGYSLPRDFKSIENIHNLRKTQISMFGSNIYVCIKITMKPYKVSLYYKP